MPLGFGADFANCRLHADANRGRENMKHLMLALLCLMSLVATAGAATPEADLLAPIHQFIDSFNKGDSAAAEAANLSTGVTISTRCRRTYGRVPARSKRGPRTWTRTTRTRA
jgi:hypothetical protein